MKILFGIVIGYLLSDMISKGYPTVAQYKVKTDWFSSLYPELRIDQPQIQQGESLRDLIM